MTEADDTLKMKDSSPLHAINLQEVVRDNSEKVPKGVSVDKKKLKLTIKKRWFKWYYIPLAIIVLIINYYTLSEITEGTFSWQDLREDWGRIVFLSVLIIVSYYTLACLVNRTTIIITRSRISVNHGPLPWYGYVSVRGSHIDQLYCEKKSGWMIVRPYKYYVLKLKQKKGKTISLMAVLHSPEIVQYIEDKIETWLGIRNRDM